MAAKKKQLTTANPLIEKYEKYERFRHHVMQLAAREVTPQLKKPSVSFSKTIIESVTLYYKNRAENSDKVYKIRVVANPSDPPTCCYHVEYEHGRRGGTMRAGKKNTVPVTERVARRMFDELLAEKKLKGYTY
jgi:hypothetical protein